MVDYGTGAGGFVYRLAKAEPQLQVVPFPERLSGTGLFSDVRELKPASGVLPYVINVPGWHDGAESVHHMALPGDGKLELRSSKSWQAPDGTALAQTLNIGGRRIETRVLLKQQNDWAGYSYVWNAEQSEATLAPKAGADMEIGGGQPWRVPSRAECMMCHSRQANFALTLHDAQLNHGDQLQRWERMGLLSSNAAAFDRERAQFGKTPRPASSEERQRGSPVTGLLPRNPDRLAKFVKSNHEGATVEQRARSYLGVNCAHCHTIYGGGNSPMEFDWFVSLKEMQTIDRAPEHGTLDLENARVVAPGAPGRSVLIPRVARRGPGQMPPVGTRVGDPEGVRVLAEWVMSLRE